MACRWAEDAKCLRRLSAVESALNMCSRLLFRFPRFFLCSSVFLFLSFCMCACEEREGVDFPASSCTKLGDEDMDEGDKELEDVSKEEEDEDDEEEDEVVKAGRLFTAR